MPFYKRSNSMDSSYNLSHLNNETVLRQLTRLIGHDRQHEAKVLAHIGEVDARQLYAQAAYSSMFAYCLGELRLSEAEAFRRITAARAARRFPVLLHKVAAGELHLCAIKLLAPRLNDSNCAQLVALATHASKKTVERRLAALFPKKLVEDSVRKLPARRESTASPLTIRPDAKPEAANCLQLTGALESTASPAVVAEARAIPELPRDTVAPLATDRYMIKFTANEALRNKIDRAKELLPGVGNDLAGVFDRALDALIGDLERKRFGSKRGAKAATKVSELVLEPATSQSSTPSRKRSRSIPRSVRRAVDRRDGGQCTFARADGLRCSERRRLEMHHVQPFARGGPNTADNLTLRCKTHNLYAAELDFSRRTMQRFRSREPAAVYETVARHA